MSSVYDNPRLTEQLLEQCLPLLMQERVHTPTHQALRHLDDESFVRQGGSFPSRLAELLEERSRGKFTILQVDPAIVPHPFKRSVYFVRYGADLPAVEPVIEPLRGMVLCEINPYVSKLIVGGAFNAPEKIQHVLAQRAEARAQEVVRQEEAGYRRERVSELSNQYTARLELLVQQSDNPLVHQKWQSMRSPLNQYRGHLMFDDILELCDLLGTGIRAVIV